MYYTVTAATDLTGSGKGRRLLAWDFAENNGTPGVAQVLLRDGGASGTIVVQIELTADSSKHQAYPAPAGRLFPAGLYVDVAAGAVRGSVELI